MSDPASSPVSWQREPFEGGCRYLSTPHVGTVTGLYPADAFEADCRAWRADSFPEATFPSPEGAMAACESGRLFGWWVAPVSLSTSAASAFCAEAERCWDRFECFESTALDGLSEVDEAALGEWCEQYNEDYEAAEREVLAWVRAHVSHSLDAMSEQGLIRYAGALRERTPAASYTASWRDAAGQSWDLPCHLVVLGGRVVLWSQTDEAGVADEAVADAEHDLEARVREFAMDLARDLDQWGAP